MAFTPDQQYIADIVSANKNIDSEQCCLSLGGDVIDTGEGEMLCSFETYEFPLELACQTLGDVGENEDSADDQGPSAWGGIGDWFGENIGGLTTSFTDIWSLFNPPETPPPGTNPGTTPPTDDEDKEKSKNQIWLIVGFVLVLVLAVYLIRKRS